MATSAEDRATLIAAVKKRLLEVTTGHTDAEAEQAATAFADEAIAQRDHGRAG
jgi:N-acetylglucosamine-6-phosphate deacetylase